jgi:hypothetical protein
VRSKSTDVSEENTASNLTFEELAEQEPSVKSDGTKSYGGFLLGLSYDPQYLGNVPPKRRLTFNGVHGIISQRTILSITTTVKTSNSIKQ